MLDDPEDLAILMGIMGLARAFGRGVVAEGVETEEEGRMLLRLGCEEGQGYAIARPMPATELPHWVSSWSPLASWPETPAASAEGQILIVAMTEHRAWVRWLDEWCRGTRADPPAINPLACRFGQRLRSGALSGTLEPGLLDEISALHDVIHILGQEIMNLRESGHFDNQPQLMTDLCGKRDQLVHCMEQALDQPN
jgi:hypothetical protein